MGLLQEMFSYPFLVRAMIGGICISLCASLLGVSLVLKRYSMIGDGLSHVSFGALSIAVAFNWAPLAVSIPKGNMGQSVTSGPASSDHGKRKDQE